MDPENTDPWWRFAGVSKNIPDTSTKLTDSNGKQSNGVYSGVGKCWGTARNSVGASFKVIPCKEAGYNVSFGHTHTAINKPSSGDSDLGSIENCSVYALTDLKKSSTYSAYSFDTENVWNIQDASLPELKQNINRFDIAK